MEVPTWRDTFMPDLPAYLQIAAEIRDRIIRGELAPGDALPTTAQLMDQYRTSVTTVRNAIGVLTQEGLLEGTAGGRVRVREVRRLVREAHGRDQRQAAGSTSPFARDARAGGQAPSWEHSSAPEEATDEIAARLAIEPGDPVMRTTYRYLADGHPIQLATSWEPLALTGGTEVERPEHGPVVGVVARFDHLGIRIDATEERITWRAARPDEIDLLELPARGGYVLVIARTYTAGLLPAETADIVVDAGRYELIYRIPID